jgi:ferredoxin
MALLINSDCISCDACESECPNEAISPAEEGCVIDPTKCTECVGHYQKSQCVAACPADCIVPDPNHRESKEQLQEKYQQLTSAKE